MAGDVFDPTIYARGRTASSNAEKDAPLPGANDSYKAAGFADNEVSRLVFIMGKDGFKPGAVAYVMLQYVHLGLGEFGFTEGGQWFRFVFADIQPKLVTAHGRNLHRIFDSIGLRRAAWVRQADRDFRESDAVPDDEPIITSLEIRDWTPPESQEVNPGQGVNGHRM